MSALMTDELLMLAPERVQPTMPPVAPREVMVTRELLVPTLELLIDTTRSWA
jgi:hypothetical protein